MRPRRSSFQTTPHCLAGVGPSTLEAPDGVSPGGDSHGASEGGRHCECRECNASLVSNAVTVMRIATGEIEEATAEDGKNKAAVELGRKGGTARAFFMTLWRPCSRNDGRSCGLRWG